MPRSSTDLPKIFHEVAAAWSEALEHGAQFSAMQEAIRARDVKRVKEIWNRLIPIWDDRTFYGFIATSDAFMRRSFRHLEIFGQVGFGTGGWDTDFPNSMLEILRVVVHQLRRGPAAGSPAASSRCRGGCGRCAPDKMAHWPRGTSLESLHAGAPRPGVTRIARSRTTAFAITDRWGATANIRRVLVTCQSWLLTTHIEVDERIFSPEALDGAGPHPLHAIGQDLRHGRPAVLEGQGSEDRPRSS